MAAPTSIPCRSRLSCGNVSCSKYLDVHVDVGGFGNVAVFVQLCVDSLDDSVLELCSDRIPYLDVSVDLPNQGCVDETLR